MKANKIHPESRSQFPERITVSMSVCSPVTRTHSQPCKHSHVMGKMGITVFSYTLQTRLRTLRRVRVRVGARLCVPRYHHHTGGGGLLLTVSV